MKSRSFNKRAWWIFAGCCITGVLFVGMICNTAGLYFSDMEQELKLPMTKVALTMSFLNAGGLIGTLFAGRLLMNTDVRIVTSVAAAACGSGFLLGAVCRNIIGFYMIWLMVGVCTPVLVTITIPTLLGNWFKETSGTMTGIVYGLSGVGGALFNAATGWVIANFGWRHALRLEGILALLGILPFTLFIFRIRPDEDQNGHADGCGETEADCTGNIPCGITARMARKCKSFYLYIAAGMALTIASSLLQQVSPHIINLGYDITVSSAVMSAIMLGCAVGNVMMGVMLDRCRFTAVIRLYALFGLAGWMGIAFVYQRLLLMMSGILAGLAQAVFQTALPFCYRRTYGDLEFCRISADLALPSSLLGVFSASLGGILYDLTGSYRIIMALLSVMFIVAEPCIDLAMRKREWNDI